MTLDSVYSIIIELSNTPSKTEAKQILKRNSDEVFKEVLFYGLNPFFTYGVLQLPEVNSEGSEIGWEELKDILDKLRWRILSGNNAKEVIESTLKKLSTNSQKVFKFILTKDFHCGIGIKTVNSVFTKLIPEFNVMLASEAKLEDIEYPTIVEPKYDGIRVLAAIEKNQNSISKNDFADFYDAVFFSRNGIQLHSFYKLHNSISKKFSGFVLDGEMTGENFLDITKIFRTKKQISLDTVTYNVFDIIPSEDFFSSKPNSYYTLPVRKSFLKNHIDNNSSIKSVPYNIVNNELELNTIYEKWLNLGYEGIIIKNLNGLYEYKRSKNWLKLKPFHTEDVPIKNIIEGEGKYKNSLGALEIIYKGKLVRVGSGFSDELRNQIWKDAQNLQGKIIEIKYQEETPDGSLRFPVFIKFRPDKESSV